MTTTPTVHYYTNCSLMLYIVLAYLMLFAALSNAVCLYNASFLPMISANAFYFIYFLDLLTHSLFISCTVLLICWFFQILCSHRFCFFYIERAMCSPEK